MERVFICIRQWWGVRFANMISFFLNISMRPDYFIFIGHLKKGEAGDPQITTDAPGAPFVL